MRGAEAPSKRADVGREPLRACGVVARRAGQWAVCQGLERTRGQRQATPCASRSATAGKCGLTPRSSGDPPRRGALALAAPGFATLSPPGPNRPTAPGRLSSNVRPQSRPSCRPPAVNSLRHQLRRSTRQAARESAPRSNQRNPASALAAPPSAAASIESWLCSAAAPGGARLALRPNPSLESGRSEAVRFARVSGSAIIAHPGKAAHLYAAAQLTR
jgi:hypothetical protein